MVDASLAVAGVPPEPLDDVPPPPNLRSVVRQFGPRALTDAVIPLVLFLALNSTAGVVSAIVAATLWSLALIALRRLRGQRVGVVVWIAAGYVALRGTAGALTQSSGVFFGPGVINNFIIGLAFLASVVAARPAVGAIARAFYPFQDYVRAHAAYRQVFSRLTLAWAAYLILGGGLQLWLLATQSTNTFLLARAAFSWPIALALFVFSLHYPRRAFARVPDLAPFIAAAEAARTRGRGSSATT
jgi:intracellular septation protein A